MDKKRHLQDLLGLLRAHYCGGNAAELGRRIDTDGTYINRLFYPPGKPGGKGIGPDIMDKASRAFDLPRGFWEMSLDEASAAIAAKPVLEQPAAHPKQPALRRPLLDEALPVVLEAMAAVRSRAELRQLLPMLVDTNAEAYRTRLLELLQEAASNQPQEQEARVNPAYQDLADAEVKLAEDRKRNEKKHGRQPPAAHAA